MLHLRMDGPQRQEREQLCLLLAGVKQAPQFKCADNSHLQEFSLAISLFALSRLRSGPRMSTLSQLQLPDSLESGPFESNRMVL